MAGKEDLKLVGLPLSPFVMRVCMALTMKGVSYEYVEEDLTNKSELLLKLNPVHKKVPVLIHNGKPICESLIILQYVDELFAGGRSILPTHPYERATARFWAAYADDKLFPAWYGMVKAAQAEEEMAEKMKETLAAIEHMEVAFAECSGGGNDTAFFGGDSIGYVDIVLGSFLFWFEAVRRVYDLEIIDASRTPLLAAWAERFGRSVEAKEVVLVPEVVDLAVQYINKFRAPATAAAAKLLASSGCGQGQGWGSLC